ncbi:MAG: HD domain-containing protein [Firmicutes bacterium]|nr:HD domain-containing protein [Bacillota bacterium]MCL2770785.1 HD domain-containing protein [Bacillota bacterium]
MKEQKIDLEKALYFAKIKHEGQTRQGGEPYVTHPIRVAEIIKENKVGAKYHDELIAAALLHDTMEDTETSYQELKRNFGEMVASLVLELTDPKYTQRYLGKKEYMTKKMGQMTSYVLTLKLADRLDNLRDMKNATEEFRQRQLTDTRYILENLDVEYTNSQQKLVALVREELAKYEVGGKGIHA